MIQKYKRHCSKGSCSAKWMLMFQRFCDVIQVEKHCCGRFAKLRGMIQMYLLFFFETLPLCRDLFLIAFIEFFWKCFSIVWSSKRVLLVARKLHLGHFLPSTMTSTSMISDSKLISDLDSILITSSGLRILFSGSFFSPPVFAAKQVSPFFSFWYFATGFTGVPLKMSAWTVRMWFSMSKNVSVTAEQRQHWLAFLSMMTKSCDKQGVTWNLWRTKCVEQFFSTFQNHFSSSILWKFFLDKRKSETAYLFIFNF